ncbi:hypothetical protein COU88_00990 [Candidatus Roizmanbacteria bacterium CG10_big_fil_rev_8_21_14_0_10_39_6]|uniref:Antitoxin n=1 Tax=Candidatus Roizmanbacteria bacterium CG10_big_fil_rev_8_21_14_0_10_39_6 TaxID=1974853 RepID=A0A2M8KTG7_9BACT|nr:MAG: hypothetical protein COU88_00990 [Candidatus Roizmanbacteria bacterium CG10_big_fil_rev_8_21_14_0_10_39_6]
MQKYTIVDASEARNNFFKIIDSVYTDKKTFIVKKAGIPLVQVTYLENKRKDPMAFAGIWARVPEKRLAKRILLLRKDKTTKSLPDTQP